MERRDFVKLSLITYPCLIISNASVSVNNPIGVITRPSPFAVPETMDRLVACLEEHGATLYARIDQQAEVQRAGQSIPPLEFILFGNPKAGGKVMALKPLAALDLPLKVIVWEDKQKQHWLAYNKADYIGERYTLPDGLVTPLNLDNLIDQALKL